MTVKQIEDDDYEGCEDPEPPVPPDGGWGWIVVAASLLCNIIVDGVCFSFGIFYVEFLDSFGESKSKTAWVGSLLAGCYLSMGPVTSALANKFGCRVVTIAGSILAAASFILSTYSPNVDVLIFTYGVMGGIGFGLVYLPAIVIVGFYFEKKRAFATGIAVCGSGIGTFIFAPLARRLLAEYGWRGGNVIIAGIILNGAICGCLFRPLEAKKCKKRKLSEEDINPVGTCVIMQKLIEEKKRQRTISTHSLDNVIITHDNKLIKDLSLLDNKTDKVKCFKDRLKETFSKSNSSINRSGQYLSIPTIIVDGPVNGDTRQSKVLLSAEIGAGSKSTVGSQRDVTKFGGSLYLKPNGIVSCHDVWRASCGSSPHLKVNYEEKRQDIARPLYRKDIFYSGSVFHVPQFIQSQQNIQEYVKSITGIPTATSTGCCARLPKPMRDVFVTMLDISLLTSPTFVVLCISSVFAMLGFFVPFVYITDNALIIGVPMEKATFLLSILGITNTIGRVVSGFVSDRPWADCLFINNIALIIAGLATIVVPFCNSYGLLATYCAVFGTCIAAFVSLRSIILVDLLGIEKLTNAFGLLILFQGLASIIGSPLAGWFFDVTANYNASFYLAGGLIAASGVVCLPLRHLAQWEENREKKDFIPEEGYEIQYVKVSQKETVL